jgi:1,4-alpha-glucan branching enzyme
MPALHEQDCEAQGFEWIDATDHERGVVAFLRRGKEPGALAVVVCNFTPVPRPNYRVGVPEPGFYAERINTDSLFYGGSNVGNGGGISAEAVAWHGRPHSLDLTLPPLGTLILEWRGA